MPESPDFESIAESMVPPQYVGMIAEQLRLVWNARGAADASIIRLRTKQLVAGEIVGSGLGRHFDEAIQGLDR
jgi:hypothetical protein